MLKPSARTFEIPRISATVGGRLAPAAPATMAKVVTPPSIDPRTASPNSYESGRWRGARRLAKAHVQLSVWGPRLSWYWRARRCCPASLKCAIVGRMMRRVSLIVLIGALWLPLAAKEAAPQPDESFVYKQTEQGELQMHLFKPSGWSASDQRPAVVFFFGGGWTSGDPKQFFPHARHLADLGFVAASVEYRIKTKHNTAPDRSIADGRSAVHYLRSHAAKLGIDPQRIAAGGGSAGGHVAAATATISTFDEEGGQPEAAVPNALVLFNPVLNVVGLKVAAGRFGGNAESGSPQHQVRRGLPPTIIFHGAADTTVPFAQAEAFCEKANQVGSACEVVGYEGKGHGFFNYTRDPAIYADTMRHVERFFRELGWTRH